MSLRLTGDEIAEAEAFASTHGLAALLDHLGLDGLGNEVTELRRALQIAAEEDLGESVDYYRAAARERPGP